MSNNLNDISRVYLDQIANIKKTESEGDTNRWTQTEAKVDTGSAAEKATARNKRNTPAGKDYKFDTSVFITRKPGESLDSARTRTRQKAHAAKRSVKEAYRVLAKSGSDKGKPSQFSYKDEKDAKKFADSIKKDGGRATVTKEGFSNWRTDLAEVIDTPTTDTKDLKTVDVKKGIKNKVIINPKLTETIAEIGGELLEVTEYDPIESAIEYLYEEGINEEGIDLLIEEIGLDGFVEFIEEGAVYLNEERSARKASVRAKSYEKVKAEVDKADAARKASKKGEYATSYAKKETDVTDYGDDKPAAKKKAPAKKPVAKKVAPKPVAKKAATIKKVAKKDYDGDGKKETPRAEYTGSRNKAIKKAVVKAKAKQPVKKATKKGLGSKIRSAYEAGRKRHSAAVGKAKTEVGKVVKTAKTTAKQHSKHRKDFVKGISPSAKEKKIAKGVGGAVKKALTREELELLELKKATLGSYVKKASKDLANRSFDHGESEKRQYEPDAADEKERKKQIARQKGIDRAADKLAKEEVVLEKDLNAAERRALPNKDFVFPGKGEGPKGKQRGAYPIPDKKHARNALAMAAAHASPEKQAKVKAAVKKKFPDIEVSEAKVDTGSAEEKATARNKRNTPAGKDYKFDTSVFITRKPGESLDSARTRMRQKKHGEKRGVSESRDKALDIVRQRIIKKHGEGAIYDAKRDKPTEAQKKTAAAERKKRDADKAKAFADRAKKAGYKSTQDYANVVARYGSEDNMKKGRGLGT